MNIYIDVGNTTTKFGVDVLGEVSCQKVVATKDLLEHSSNDVFDSFEEVTNVYVSSVVPKVSDILSQIVEEKYEFSPIFISPRDEAGVIIKIDNPNELGTDLLCDLAAGRKLVPNDPLLIVDLGTATKFLLIDKNGVFSSCAIIPGLELSLKILNEGTALLPEVKQEKLKKLIDLHNTVDVLTSSVQYVQIESINGLVKRYEKEIGYPVKKLLTGGNLNYIKNYLDFDFLEKDNLCLTGIKQIIDLRR